MATASYKHATTAAIDTSGVFRLVETHECTDCYACAQLKHRSYCPTSQRETTELANAAEALLSRKRNTNTHKRICTEADKYP